MSRLGLEYYASKCDTISVTMLDAHKYFNILSESNYMYLDVQPLTTW